MIKLTSENVIEQTSPTKEAMVQLHKWYAQSVMEDFKIRLADFSIEQLNELSQEIRKARKRLKYDDRANNSKKED